jgi:glycopeptide antibiotics resistance protein
MTTAPTYSATSTGWSNRFLLLATAGILFLTLYPFRFSLTRHRPGLGSPFLLEGLGKDGGRLDLLLNVLLFMPFGFGLAAKLHEWGKSKTAALLPALLCGASLSYLIEFLQIYIPSRDSGWTDVGTNSTGSLLGALVFLLFGALLLPPLSSMERIFGTWMAGRHGVIICLIYFGLWFAFSASLQTESRPSHWNPRARLLLGYSAARRSASGWTGQILRLQLWDRALPEGSALRISASPLGSSADPAPLADFDFSGFAPFHDQRHSLPDLSWASKTRLPAASDGAVFDGTSWLGSGAPISVLTEDLPKTHQFALRLVCRPASIRLASTPVVLVAPDSGPPRSLLRPDLLLEEEGPDLIFWFRTPLSISGSRMSWDISDVFHVGQSRDILFSYDGSNLSLFIDGQKRRSIYDLGPPAALARTIRSIKTAELLGYRYIFYAVIFFPVGSLLGLSWRKTSTHPVSRAALVFFGFLLPPLLLELLLMHLAGRRLSAENVLLSILFAAAGGLWVNADRSASTFTIRQVHSTN